MIVTFAPERWSGRRILVLGDVMLDRFIDGSVGRVSPEAPIPILLRARERTMLGGAGNVARNLIAMGASASLVGVRGRDEAGTQVADLCAEIGISARLVTSAGKTTQKVRFIAQGQQLLRVDEEDGVMAADGESELLAALREEMRNVELLVVSDYAKGVVTPAVMKAAIEAARTEAIPVVVDPKRPDLGLYSGATVLTPNAREVLAVTGIDPRDLETAEAAARAALSQAEAEAILLTRGPQGMTVVTAESAHHFPSMAREVFDVSGAGDTVVASLALGLASGQDIATSAFVANAAAGIVVSKAGTATVSRSEIAAALEPKGVGPGHGSAPLETAIEIVHRWRGSGLRVGFTNGCFDLIHTGHIHLLRQARAVCDRLIVGLNTDASVRGLKGPERPIQDEQARASILAAFRMVDVVVLFDEPTPLELIRALQPDVLVKGADYAGKTVVGREDVEARGGSVILADFADGQSTTDLVARRGPELTRSGTR